MKIGLTTIYNVPNFGSVLQAYATQYILESLGHKVFIINYKFPNEWHYRKGLQKPSLKSKISILLGIRPYHRKVKKLQNFRRHFLHLTKLYNSLEDLKKECWDSYNLFCVGSDQVWNPRFVLGDSEFMLSYIPENKARISLASSFATKSLQQELREKYSLYLSKFQSLSVREKNGVDIINNELHIDKHVHVLLDPTLLISGEQWLQLADKSFHKDKKYILLYMLCYAFEPRPLIFDIIRYYQKQMNCDVIALEGFKEAKSSGINMVDATNSSIGQFISYFKNADLVITSSFHGTAFAANFGIPLISIVPNNTEDDRQSTLLKMLSIEACAVSNGMDYSSHTPYYDKDKEQKRLYKYREESIDWIKKSINNIKTI